MKAKSVPSGWLRDPGIRLSARPYFSAAREARATLALLTTTPLSSLTSGGKRGIFNGPRFARHYVEDPKYGVPLLSGSEMLSSDLSHLSFISGRHAASMPEMFLSSGTTLITSYGTVGRTAYVRDAMRGMVGSDNAMKVIPDSSNIPPGYLFAFLSCSYGVPLATVGTTGGVVQFLPPERLFDLPVPRLGRKVEGAAHELIDEAAQLRDQAAAAQREAITRVQALLGWTGIPSSAITQAASSALQRRLDAFHHTPRVVGARGALAGRAAVRVGDKVESVFEPNRGPRLKVDDPAFGVPFLSSSEVFRLDPVGEYSISKRRTPHLDKLIVSERDLLLPRSGQLGGIIGRAVLPLPTYYGHAASEHLVRVRCKSKEDAFFLWPVFASEPGYLATIGTAFGSSIPSLDCELIADMKVPWFDDAKRLELSKLVAGSIEASTRAVHAERKAVRIVEDAIEKGATN